MFKTGIPKGKGPQTISANKYAGPDMAGFSRTSPTPALRWEILPASTPTETSAAAAVASQHAYGNVIDIERGFGSGPDNSPALACVGEGQPG